MFENFQLSKVVEEMNSNDNPAEKAKKYDQIVDYFRNILQDRADKLRGEMIYYDEWKQPRYMDRTEREQQVIDEFEYKMDDIGFNDFAELMAYEIFGENMIKDNQFNK